MTTYRYAAARADGATVRGYLDAASAHDAAALVSARGLYPTAVTEAERPKSVTQRASTRSAGTAFQSLGSLVGVGVPLHRALEVTARLVPEPLAGGLTRVEARVREGGSLAGAMAAEQGLFGETTLGLIAAGERGMGLGPALALAGEDLDRQAETSARIASALAYPAVLAVVGSLSVAFIVLVIVPRFVGLLGDVGSALPASTRLLVAVSHALREHLAVVIGVAVALVAAAVHVTTRYRAAWQAWALSVPVVGPLRHGLATARAARAFAALLRVGTPALAALDIARSAAGDAGVAARITRARERVAEGAGLSAALAASEALTPTALQLAGIGEASGALPDLLERAAYLEETLAERRTKALVSLLEPALILAFAAVVAFVAAALLQALYSLRPGSL